MYNLMLISCVVILYLTLGVLGFLLELVVEGKKEVKDLSFDEWEGVFIMSSLFGPMTIVMFVVGQIYLASSSKTVTE
jgi:hypothetical protein